MLTNLSTIKVIRLVILWPTRSSTLKVNVPCSSPLSAKMWSLAVVSGFRRVARG